MAKSKKKIKSETIGISLPHLKVDVILHFQKKSEVDWLDGAEAYTNIYNDNQDPEIFFNIENPISIVTVVHECTHAVVNILQYRGFKTVGDWDDEALPYHLGYVVGEVVKIIGQKGIKLTD